MRLAFYSPLNPVPSGISDYSEELLPLLAREFEIELVVDDYTPTNPLLSEFPIRTRADFQAHAREFEFVLYHMGNSPAHAQIYQTLREIPGVVVMHDLVLHHLRAWQTLDRRDVNGYLQAMRADYGEAGAELARLEAQGLAGLDRFDYPLNGEVVRAARAVIVHSKYAARQIQPLIPATPIGVIPMGIQPMPNISLAETRARMSLPSDAFIVAAFGEIHPHKRVTIALQAFAEFHARFPKSIFVLIGRESPNYEIEAILHGLRLGDAVRRIGFAPRADYANYIAAADVCLNLRYPTAGETSASLLRLFAAGKAVVVTRTGAYAELPDAVCAKIDADEYEQDMLRAHLEFFAQRPDVRETLGARALEFVTQGHTLQQSATAYAEFLRAVYEGRAESRSYLRERTDDAERTTDDGRSMTVERKAEDRERKAKKDGGHLTRRGPAVGGLPSIVSSPPSSFGPADWREAVALAYAELGLDPEDATLTAVAQAIVALGLKQKERGA